MQLRHHPLLSYRGIHSWPPVWTLMRGTGGQRPRGEVGILEDVHLSTSSPDNAEGQHSNRIFIFIDHGGQRYIGCLLIDDQLFCEQLADILRGQLSRSIAEIGGLDVGGTL
jgi:hypothetical protein